MLQFDDGGLDFLKADTREYAYGLHCGSLFGLIRNFIGVENCSYLYVDDEPLFDEIIQTVGELCFQCVKSTLETGAKFDFAHFWEDICFKNGPLVVPSVFAEKVGPHYNRITGLLKQYGINIVSLDCDGLIDSLLPIWLENGVNTMFPIEVGTWNASIAPWRKQFGKELRGVGGMNKVVFSRDRKAIDTEIERLRPLVELGGYIPCPHHRIAPDAKWDNVRYYCDKMHEMFS
jgi:uroporphyrinogen decarboxylase